jgi:hypothetical protein
MVQIVRYLALCSLATVGLSMVVKRDVIAVKAGITAIAEKTTALDNSIKAFSNSLPQALVRRNLYSVGSSCAVTDNSLFCRLSTTLPPR